MMFGVVFRFVESEVELNEVIQEMHALATVPEYYSILTDLNTIQSLLHLLSHDNTDISNAAVDLLQVISLVPLILALLKAVSWLSNFPCAAYFVINIIAADLLLVVITTNKIVLHQPRQSTKVCAIGVAISLLSLLAILLLVLLGAD